jgi:hypothetical protein
MAPMAFAPGERTRNYWLTVQARLKAGVTIEQARAEMDPIGARIATDYPDSNKGSGVSIVRYGRRRWDAAARRVRAAGAAGGCC